MSSKFSFEAKPVVNKRNLQTGFYVPKRKLPTKDKAGFMNAHRYRVTIEWKNEKNSFLGTDATFGGHKV